jgi:F-type H+-transporting ATPase subunit gamma
MATLREVRRRIAGVKSTQKITKAMKMVSAAKLRRAQLAVVAARPYARAMRDLLQHLLVYAEGPVAAFVQPREVKNVAVVVVTSDRGLCGAFNSNLIRAAVQHLRKRYPEWNGQGRVRIYCVGKKATDFFSRRAFSVAEKFVGIFGHLTFIEAQRVARILVDGYTAGTFDRVDVIYNEFKSIAQQNIVVEQFLPVPPAGVTNGAAPSTTAGEYIYEPSKAGILESLLPKHLNFQIWRVLLESNAAEQGARMAAMDNATENANELIETLQLQYNKARQASITKELLEIVGGAEALR